MVTISAADVRRLLSAQDSSAALVVVGGRAEVVSGDELDTEPYVGALTVTTREDLLQSASNVDLDDESGRGAHELAARLNAAVNALGG